MDKFKTVLDIANKQANLSFGLVALLTAGGEHIFSSVVFRCPCNVPLNFYYGMVFLLVPALALLLLGYILSKKTWKLFTGLCQRRSRTGTRLCSCRRLKELKVVFTVLCQISTTALVAPTTWIAGALLNGNYYECAMTGTNVSFYNQRLCSGNPDAKVQSLCQKELHRFPCETGSSVEDDRKDVMLTLKAHSQILGWLLIASIMLFSLLLTCVARCTSPISYLQLKFWRAYSQQESSLFDSHAAQHAKKLAERNLESFFNQTEPQDIITPSNKAWEEISSLYKFSTKDHYYSTLHCHVEKDHQETDSEKKNFSIKSHESVHITPAAISDFVDGGHTSAF